jgi:hypothetical protein
VTLGPTDFSSNCLKINFRSAGVPQKSSRNLHLKYKWLMERVIKFIVILLFVSSQRIFAQQVLTDSFLNKSKSLTCFPAKGTHVKAVSAINLHSFSIANEKPALTNTIPGNFYTNCFGFFCRKELMLEKSTKLPFRFRLGSLEYVDRLERKVR